MKRFISLLLALTMLLSACLCLASCGAPEDLGAEIVVCLGEGVYDLDPTEYVTSDNAVQAMSLLFEPLFSLSENDRLGYAAAKKYKVDKKTRTITITLRESYWSDKTQVTADDFLYAWQEILLNPNHANPAAALLYDIENAVEVKNGTRDLYDLGVIAEGTTLIVTYREGADYMRLLKNMASVFTAPLRRDIVSKAPDFWTKRLDAVYNGPFVVSAYYASEGCFRLSRNEGYHQAFGQTNPTKKVTPHQLVPFRTEEGDVALSYRDIEEKTVFFLGAPSAEDRATYRKKITSAETLSTYSYVFNVEKPLFADENVRRALLLALPRDQIADALVFAEAATGLLPASVLDTATGRSFRKNNALISASADMAAAREALAKADLSALDRSFTLTVEDTVDSLIIAGYAKQAWEELGFNVTVQPVGYETHKKKDANAQEDTVYDSQIQVLVKDAALGLRNFDVIGLDMNFFSKDAFVGLAAFAADYSGNGASYNETNGYTDPETGLEYPPTNERIASRGFFSGWSSSAYDEKIDLAFGAEKKKERSNYLHEAEEILLASGAVCPVVFNQSYAFVSSDLTRVKTDGFGLFVFTRAKQKKYKKYLKED